MKKSICTFLILTVFSNDGISGVTTSKISYIQINNRTPFPNVVAIKPEVMPSNRPACATDPHGRFAVSLETEAGKAVYAMALAAQASGKVLEIYGNNVCIAGALEEIDFIRIKD